MTDLVLLTCIAFLASAITAMIGIGGGSLLIASMPGFLPGAAIIPIHAVVQLFSNLSRALSAYRHIHWDYVTSFIVGSVSGAMISVPLIKEFNFDHVPILIACYILYVTWGPKLEISERPKSEFVIFGFVQTILSLFVGAIGPLGQSLLLRKGLNLHALIVSTALFMVITHAIKIVVFGVLGFSFNEYWILITCMVIGSILGSIAGTYARSRVPNWNHGLFLKVLFTGLAIRMILVTVY